MIQRIEEEICGQHAEEAAFLWMLRNQAAEDPLYDAESLGELDERVEAHLDGLRLAGDPGWAACKEALSEGGSGHVFTASVLAVERWDLKGLASILDMAGADPALARGIEGGLLWVPLLRVRRLLPGLLSGRCPPPLVYLGIAACALHREDPGSALSYAILSSDTRLRARALRAAGELLRRDLLREVEQNAEAEDEACRYWAAFSMALLGHPDAGRHLWAMASSSPVFAEQACALSMRRMDVGIAHTWLQSLANRPGSERVALAGAAALLDPVMVPWLLDCMQVPELARRAGFALAMITGLDIADAHLDSKAPEGVEAEPNDEIDDENVEMDPDESLAWPDGAAIRGWWSREGGNFKKGRRYLMGKPITPDWLSEVLVRGSQPARAAAAMELCLMGGGRKLDNVERPRLRRIG